MKKIISIIMILCTVVSLTACGGSESEAREDFESIMQAFKTCDKSKIEEYYSVDKLTAYIETEEGKMLSEAVLKTLSKMDYRVNSAEKLNSNAVKLNVEITTVDFSEIMDSYIEKVTELVKSSEYLANVNKMNDEEYKDMMAGVMIECIKNCSDATVSKTTDVTMIKGDNGWSLGGNSDEFLGVLFENLSNAVESLI